MNGTTRRRLLAGVSAGGALLSTLVTAGDRELTVGDTTAQSQDGPLDVTITEVDVGGAGSRLDVTAEIENIGSSDVRTAVDLLVGDDAERVGRVRTTIEAGETRELSQGYYTYPTPTDSEFPVRVAAGDAIDERTVSVAGAGSLSVVSPDRAVTIEPETAVLFEVGGDAVENAQETVWWIDGDRVGGGFGGPWEAAYEAETGRRYWFETFDTEGRYEVAAAVVPEDGGDTTTASWTVEVRDDGNASPSIDAVEPSAGSRSYRSGDTATFELDVTDPDGSLDRVVWWLTQADVVLDITELDGESDTATLSVDADRLCFACQVQPWVIATDGTVTSVPDTWEIGAPIEDDGVRGSIVEMNEPVDGGESLAVTVELDPAGSASVTADIELIVGHDPTVVDTQTVTIDRDSGEELTLGYETYPTTRDEQFPIRVEADGEPIDERSVVVRGQE